MSEKAKAEWLVPTCKWCDCGWCYWIDADESECIGEKACRAKYAAMWAMVDAERTVMG